MRETKFSILKALAIICVVLCHSGVPGWMNHFLFIFHVPVFFICAGYFFNTAYLTNERTYVVHRLKGLYLPFLRWSLVFLVLHNVFFSVGILSEHYGNLQGGVTHPYNWHQFCQHLWSIVFNMSGYDQFLGGTFWFFRALFVASLLFLVLFKILRKSEHFKLDKHCGWGILLLTYLCILWKEGEGLQMTGFGSGGYRELMGTFFMAAGFLLRQYRLVERLTWKLALPSFILLLLAAAFFPSGMAYDPTIGEVLKLPIPAVAGFIVLLYAAMLIDKFSKHARRILSYIGERTLYIFAFHFLAFKAVSAVKVIAYGLPWEAVGGHPYVTSPENNILFILLYLIAGIGLPLLWLVGYQRIAANVNITERQAVSFLVLASKRAVQYAYLFGCFLARFCVNCWQSLKKTIREIIAVSSTKDE